MERNNGEINMRKMGGIEKKIILFRLFFMPGGKRAAYLKKKGIFAEFGDDVRYASNTIPAEPYLVKIHNNVRIAANVHIITHDIIDGMLANTEKWKGHGEFSFHMGTIEIFDNCMIGSCSIILPNVKIGPNSIVGAGAVVTKDVPEGTIVAGNPARVIGYYDDYAVKRIKAVKLATNNDDIEHIKADYWGGYERVA